MIERHVTFHVLPGKENEFNQFFKDEYIVAMAQTPGFVSASMLRDQEKTSDMMMVLRFESVEAAAGWRSSERHAALKPRLKAHYEGSELRVFDILE